MVCKLYYKSTFRINDYLDLFSIRDDYEEEKIAYSNKQKKQTVSLSAKKKAGGLGGSKQSQVREYDEEDDDTEIDQQFDNSFGILEKLISPLNKGFEFGTQM